MREPGYWIYEAVFTVKECDAILATLSNEGDRRHRAGIRNLMSNLTIRKIADDRRLLAICREIAGHKLIPYKATLFEKTGKANWLVAFHQDTALPIEEFRWAEGWGSPSMKAGVKFAHAPTEVLRQILSVRIQLDDSTSDNGPLRVVPGSQHERLSDDDKFAEAVKDSAPIQCLTPRGGVIAMSPLILHASSKSHSNAPRRVLHIEYAPSLDIAPGIRLAMA
ncbi:MAG: phytanoyl-CoA dioxygenase family protein [Pyrinomonadaceae bacterium]